MSFVTGFSPNDKKRIEGHLRALLPHIKLENLVLVGGLDIRYHLKDHKFGPSNDLDIILKSPESLKPSVTKDFQIGHYHPIGDTEKFYIVLVHPETKTKLDIFAYDHYAPQETLEVEFEGKQLKMRTLEDQLATALLEISRVFNGHSTFKQFIENVELMMKYADLEKTQKFFSQKPGTSQDIKDRAIPVKDLLRNVKDFAEMNPDKLIDKDKKERKPYECISCVSTDAFPVTPMEETYKTLGYI